MNSKPTSEFCFIDKEKIDNLPTKTGTDTVYGSIDVWKLDKNTDFFKITENETESSIASS